MNKHYLLSEMKSTGLGYVCWFILGCHYAYLGKWETQIVYWITLGGLGIWAIVDLFRIPSMISDYNLEIAKEIEELEKKEMLTEKSPQNTSNAINELSKIKDLRDSGVISEEEFQVFKSKIMNVDNSYDTNLIENTFEENKNEIFKKDKRVVRFLSEIGELKIYSSKKQGYGVGDYIEVDGKNPEDGKIKTGVSSYIKVEKSKIIEIR